MFASAHAAEPLEHGGYVGGGVGISYLDDDGAYFVFPQDDSDTAAVLYGGYKFFKYLSIEARYSNFGSLNFGGAYTDTSAMSVHAVGTVPFGTSGWELYGQLGLGTVRFDYIGFGEEDQAAGSGGIGIRYCPSKNFAVGIQTDVFVWEDDFIGPAYDPSIGGTVLTARILF